MIRTPSLAELAVDVEKEYSMLKYFLRELNGYSEYEISSNPLANKNPLERAVAMSFLFWVDGCLKNPKFQCRSFFRDALEAIDRARRSYETLVWTDRPHAGDLLRLVGWQQLISVNAQTLGQMGISTYKGFWEKCNHIDAMLLFAKLLVPDTVENRNKMRAFGGYLVALIRDDFELQKTLDGYAAGTVSDTELLKVFKEFDDILNYYYAHDSVKDPSFDGVMEMQFRPSWQLCNPQADLPELCDVVRRVANQTSWRTAPIVPPLARQLSNRVQFFTEE